MKKRIVIALMSVLSVSMCAGCGSHTAPEEVTLTEEIQDTFETEEVDADIKEEETAEAEEAVEVEEEVDLSTYEVVASSYDYTPDLSMVTTELYCNMADYDEGKWYTDVYLKIEDKVHRIPLGWFIKYHLNNISVRAADIDSDDEVEVIITKSFNGGPGYLSDDITIVEHPMSDDAEFYIFNADCTKEDVEGDDEYWGPVPKVKYSIEDPLKLLYEQTKVIQDDGYKFTILNNKNEELTSFVASSFADEYKDISDWGCSFHASVNPDKTLMFNFEPNSMMYGDTVNMVDIFMQYEYVGDGKLKLVNLFGDCREDSTKDEAKNTRGKFVEYLMQDTIYVAPEDAPSAVTKEDRSKAKYAYVELTKNKIPVLLFYNPNASHAMGNYEILGIKQTGGDVEYLTGMDSIEAVYPENGMIVMCHWGGGFGETATFYWVMTDSTHYEIEASTSIMEDEYFAEEYRANAGEDFVDTYEIRDGEGYKQVTKEEFEEWLAAHSNEKNVKNNVGWKSLHRADFDMN